MPHATRKRAASPYDAEGEILERRDGSATGSSFTLTANGGYATQHYAYVAGREIGSVDEHGSIDVLSGVTGFSNSTQGTSSYVVQAGDTLQSIAQAVYGDASLWYVVAGANGLTGDGDLAAGQSLKLPQVTTHSNTAETFKPYNPREIAGSTTPALPQAPMPAPSNHHCNALAAIVVIAVAVVVSWATYGAAAGADWAAWQAGAAAEDEGGKSSLLPCDPLQPLLVKSTPLHRYETLAMNATHVTLAEAHDRLAELIEAAKRGDEVFIETENKTQVKLVAMPTRQARVLGAYRGKLRMHRDFNAPLSTDFWLNGRS